MTNINIKTLDGASTKSITPEAIEELNGGMRGELCVEGDQGFDEARIIWNGMIDRRPGLIARCLGTGDVMLAVNFARENSLLLAVRGGGHNIAGKGVCDEGFMIDLSLMKSVRVDPATRTVWVESGVTLGDLDKETQAFGLATSVGINSTTGIAGLTLGGGFGWLTRKHGMTVDNLVAADIITADGERRRVSETENADLFWAIRGGGGNYGVVTAFQFKLHEVGPQVLSGLIVHPFDQARGLLDQFKDFIKDIPDELSCWAVLRQAPPMPFLPEEVHGKEVLIFAVCYIGDMAEGEKLLAPLRGLGKPIADVISPHPYVGWQTAFDPLLTPGARNYWKSHDFAEFNDATFDTIIDYTGNLPSPECEIFLAHLGGAMNRVPENATAYPNRDADFVVNVHTRWQDAADDDKCITWARAFYDATKPHAASSGYVNFMTEDESDRVEGAYGKNYQRLSAIKAQYDPKNMFRLNQNIPPAT